ncbi:MAG: hypothetical protein WCO98_02295 [bacterium]
MVRFSSLSQIITIFLMVMLSSAINAADSSLEWVGVVGNSGGGGEAWSIVRGILGRSGGGVVVDTKGRIYTSGGDRIIVMNTGGKRLWETKVPDKWMLGGATFAFSHGYLYFIAGIPINYEGNFNHLMPPWILVQPNICRIKCNPDALPEVLVPRSKLTTWSYPWYSRDVALTASADSTHLYVGYSQMKYSPADGYKILGYLVQEVLNDGTLQTMFLDPVNGGRISMDETGNFYRGGGNKVYKVSIKGVPLPDFTPVALPSMGAVPTGYTGSVILTKDRIWDAGHYGFVGTFTRDMKSAPGVVSQWNNALFRVTQIADAPNGDFYIKSTDALYHAALVEDKLVLKRRFGSIPYSYCLGITRQGYIGVGNDNSTGMLWFDFANNDPAAPPVRAEYPGPTCQGFNDEQGNIISYGINPGYFSLEYKPKQTGITLLKMKPEPFTDRANHAETVKTGTYDGRLIAATQVSPYIFAVDSRNNKLIRATTAEPCQFTPMTNNLPAGNLNSITSLGTSLLISIGNSVMAFTVEKDGQLTPTWTLNSIGKDNFGDTLYIAADSGYLLLSDSKRQRVLSFTISTNPTEAPKFAAQLGFTDIAGGDAGLFDSPTLVSISGGRGAVYDAGNQRVVKVRLR